MGMMKEFKEFALKGNVLDLAIGVVIGGAFAKITGSLVDDLINPLLGLLLGKVNLTDMWVALDGQSYANLAAAKAAKAPLLMYGNFINTVIQFILIAFVIFIVIKQVNKFTRLSGENLPK